MLYRRIIAAALLTTASPLAAQTFSPERIKADVSYLADDLLEGRDTGTRGYDLAARYVANRFAWLGLQPGNGASWYQDVPFVLSPLKTDATNAITIGGQKFDNGVDIVLSGTSLYPDQALDAELVFVGYGLEDKKYGFDDYRGLDVAGKVVVFLTSTPAGAPSDITADLASERPKLAESKGALGAIAIATPETLKQMSWDRLRVYGSVPRLRWLHPDGRPNVIAPKMRIGGMLGPKAAEALLRDTPLPLDKLNALIADRNARPKGFAIPGKVRYERHTAVQNMKSPNVLGLLPGSDPALADEVILMTAHLDHDGIETRSY